MTNERISAPCRCGKVELRMTGEPILRGQWLKPGAHVDLVGGFTPKMREADNDAVKRARIFVDTRDAALKDARDGKTAAERAEAAVAAMRAELDAHVDPGRHNPCRYTILVAHSWQ